MQAKPSKRKTGRTRALGAGRKKIEETYPEIRKELLLLLDGNIIGNPENPLCWTTKSLRNLEDALASKDLKTNYVTIKQLLEDMGFSLQQNKKYVESGNPGPDRDGQFQYINNILTTDKICREYCASRSREAAYFLMRLCASFYTGG